MPHIIPSRLAGSKRKLPFIDTDELVTRQQDVYLERSSDQSLHPARKRNISEWAHTYLRGEPLFLETSVLKGPFENNPYLPSGGQRRSGTETVPNSQEEIEQQEPALVTDNNDGHDNTYLTKIQVNAIAGLQSSEDVLQSIEENDIDVTKPVAYVRGQPVFPHPVINNQGAANMIARSVLTWPHQLRAENQIERWEATRRPYIQNTPWHRRKEIPPFDPATVLAQPSLPHQASNDVSVLPQLQSGFSPRFSPMLLGARRRAETTPALSDQHDVSAEDTEPATPVRQLITIDSQFLVAAAHPDTQRHLESCQTAELLDDSQINAGGVHIRLQQVLRSSPPFSAHIDERIEFEPQENLKQDVVSSLTPTCPLPTPVHNRSQQESADGPLRLQTVNDTEPPIKLKQLEDAIDHQPSAIVDGDQPPGSKILVSSSFDRIADEGLVLQGSNNSTKGPACSASTDRIESSQPQERTAVISACIPQPVNGRVPNYKPHDTTRQVSFEQSSIKKSFQTNKSFESNARSPQKKVVVSPNRAEVSDETRLKRRAAKTNSIMKTSHAGNSQQTQLQTSKKGVLTYGKRKVQSSLYSSSRNASFLQTVPKSQQERQRTVVETHGYNYDVDDDFDLDGTINELGSFLSSWDREVGT